MAGPLRIFPAYGLENAVLTSVLLGLYVRFFFTEWLGWVFSGLVVPGYLAAVFLLRPISGVVILIEGFITFVTVRGLSTLLPLLQVGTSVFGRDRFMWLVVTSVGVRVAVEALLAPWLELRLRERMGWDLSDSFGFFGIGLVLVPLLANACWKPGLVRGSFQQGICTGITFLLLQGLLATTNLNFAHAAQSFEQMVASFGASSKEYLLLLAGALLASRANLRFGWDTSGVLIAGLLCLGWFSPLRLMATVYESLLIALSATLFIRLPYVRDWNIEGPRRVVLLFTIGYLIRYCLIAILGAAAPGFEPRELFGLGYLLPSLLAVKICQRRNPALVLFPALSLSIGGLLLGLSAGYGLLASASVIASRWTASNSSPTVERCESSEPLLSAVRLARVGLRDQPANGERADSAPAIAKAPRILPADLERFSHMLRKLRALAKKDPTSCAALATEVGPSQLGLKLQAATSPAGRLFYVLSERRTDLDSMRGFGFYAVAAEPRGGPSLVVAHPQRDIRDMTTLVALSDLLSADAVLVGGSAERSLEGDADAIGDQTPLRVALRNLGGPQLRLRTGAVMRPRLSAHLPATINRTLEDRLGPLVYGAHPSDSWELVLPLASEQVLSAPLLPKVEHMPDVASFLLALTVSYLQPAAPPNTPASLNSPASDLLLAEEVVRPLARAFIPAELSSAVTLNALSQEISGAASEFGFTVALIESPHPRIGLFGHGEALLVDPAAQSEALIEVLSRRPGVAELATAIFERQSAHAILISAAKPGTEDSGPLARIAAPILALTPPPPDVILVRAGDATASDCTIVLDMPLSQSVPSELSQRIVATLEDLGVHPELRTQYDFDTSAPPSLRARLLRARNAGSFVTLTIGPNLRDRFRPAALSDAQRHLYSRLGISVVHSTLAEEMADSCLAHPPRKVPAAVDNLVKDARNYAVTRHPALLERLLARAKSSRLRLQVIEDYQLGESFLFFRRQHGSVAVTLRQQVTAPLALSCKDDLVARIRKAQAAGAASIAVGTR